MRLKEDFVPGSGSTIKTTLTLHEPGQVKMKPMIANSQYDNKEYWETRYETEASYEWFAGYCVFRKIMLQSLSKSDKILMLGEKPAPVAPEASPLS